MIESSICPTPEKKFKFATEEAAESYISSLHAKTGEEWYFYFCLCGFFHATSQNRLDFESLIPRQGDELLLAPLEASKFNRVVMKDVRGEVTEDEARSLRHPANLKRWLDCLKLEHQNLQALQTRHRVRRTEQSKQWRVNVAPYRAALLARLAEAKERIHRELRRDNHDLAARTDLTEKQKRKLAADQAIEILIAKHRLEYYKLLVERCKVVGVEPKGKVLNTLRKMGEETSLK